MTDKYGMFGPPEYITPAGMEDLSTTRSKKGPPDHGPNVKAGTVKLGKGNDATFDRFKPLNEGVKYVDPIKLQLQAKREQKSRNISDAPFKAASPMKQSAAPGDFYGTLGKVPYVSQGTPEAKKKGQIPEQPKGIYTSPAKKGTFGYNKTTLSERTGYKGVATEYEYQHDPAALRQEKEQAEREASRKAKVTESPFKPSNPPKKGTFGVPNTTLSRGKGVVGEFEYTVGANPVHHPTKQSKDAKDAPPPFRPSHTHASERVEKIEYLHDPEVPKIKAEAARRKEEASRLAAAGPWKPNMGRKTDMVRSIVRMNVR
ncbi:hypothetical protein DUNSADRAFT_16277 [Dunaliella salina]|uniref:Cilia-and flagella-associated protein 96 n=1 Tax=Dunaliella salina TaxID=3046 RepID=A0ABQ7G446_DUNSA|nr:hypothetical protein DUNSADRAFT_16277 [Dunaliella salina]|eukprot:KAF5829309.1 hypothetical protein DUNSADRAFT_16277 [Dunaliella salina]